MCISDIGIIELQGMEFYAFHGCLEEEKKSGNCFIVDFKAHCHIGDAADSDSLEDTLDYSKVYEIVSEEMSIASNLLENVAARIVNSIAWNFPEIGDFSIKVSKKNPPLSGKVEASSVTLFYHKD